MKGNEKKEMDEMLGEAITKGSIRSEREEKELTVHLDDGVSDLDLLECHV